MGKLRFTLTSLLFWFVIVFSCILAENLAVFSSNRMGGMYTDTAIVLSIFLLLTLGFYYFRERQKNKITFDKVLLPILIVFALVSVLTVWWQKDRVYINQETGEGLYIEFTNLEKLSYSLQIVVWCAAIYGVLFVNNRYAIARKWTRWLALVYVFGLLCFTLYGLGFEFKNIIAIFKNEYEEGGLSFGLYNSNVLAQLLLIGLLSCIILSVKKFNVYYFLCMIVFIIAIVLSSCSTASFIGVGAIVLYLLYEIVVLFKRECHKSMSLLITLIGILVFIPTFFALMVVLKVPLFVNIWNYVETGILQKDYGTLTSRTNIWGAIFGLLLENPRDFIFGLGYRTGNEILSGFYSVQEGGFAARSAHNGFVEIFLRHGLIGEILYLSLFVAFAIGIIKLLKKREYRVAYLYTLCVACLLGHSIAESTMFFTPNFGGTYLAIIFFLPVANETKAKHFEALKNDLLETEIVKEKRESILYFISTLVMGLLVAFASGKFWWLLIPAFASLFVLVLIKILSGKVSFKEAFVAILIKPIKNYYIPLLITLVVGLTFGFTSPLFLKVDLFFNMLLALFVFVLYNCALSIVDEKNKYLLFSYFDCEFKGRLKKFSCGVRK